MKLYAESEGNMDDAIACAHCKGRYTHPRPEYTKDVSGIKLKDTMFSVPCSVLWCEECHRLTQVHLMFAKGNTYLHTVLW